MLPKYATNYIVHKEAVKQVFMDSFGSYLFDLKKLVFPSVPFYVGSYKFSKFKSAPKFIKELENFHFVEKSFHRNDSQGKVAAHKVNFEYTNYVDKEEQVYMNFYSIVALSMSLKKKTSGVKGSSSSNPKPHEPEEEVVKKAKK